MVAEGAPLRPLTFLRTITSPQPVEAESFGISLKQFNEHALVGARGTQTAYLVDISSGGVLRRFDNPETAATPISYGSSVLQVGERVAVCQEKGSELNGINLSWKFLCGKLFAKLASR